MRLPTRVVIPYRGLDQGKTRLSGALGPEARAALGATMLRRVADACRSVVDDVVLVSPDRRLEATARTLRIGFLLQRGGGMNEAVEQARANALAGGILRMAVVSADLPNLHPGDVRALLDAAATPGSVVLAPDRAGHGTNALVVDTDLPLRFRFGARSRWAHAAEARRAGVEPTMVEREGLALDIDVPADLDAWRAETEAIPSPVPGFHPVTESRRVG